MTDGRCPEGGHGQAPPSPLLLGGYQRDEVLEKWQSYKIERA